MSLADGTRESAVSVRCVCVQTLVSRYQHNSQAQQFRSRYGLFLPEGRLQWGEVPEPPRPRGEGDVSRVAAWRGRGPGGAAEVGSACEGDCPG